MKKKYTLTLAMIARNEGENLKALWQSVKHIITEWVIVDTGSTDDTVAIARSLGAIVYEEPTRFNTELTEEHVSFFAEYGVEIKTGEKVFEFGKARNYSFSKATKDFILWLDGDDLLIGSEKLQTIINSNLDPQKLLGLHLLYKYELDQYQNPIVEHYRERVLPNNKSFKWQGRIHEIIVPELETDYIRVLQEDCHVLHNSQEERKAKSGERNTKSLLLDLYEQGEKRDPRTIFFIAEAMNLAKMREKALELYEEYLSLSGWDEERCLAAVRSCSIYLKQDNVAKATDMAFRAIREKPDFPMGYSALAQCYFWQDSYDHSEKYAKLALETKQPDTLIMIDDKFNRFIPLYVLAEGYLHQGAVKESLTFVKEAMKFEPLNKNLLRIRYTCEQMLRASETVKYIGKVTEFLKDEGELNKACNVLNNVPNCINQEPRIQAIRQELEGEMDKRTGSWISQEKRLVEGTKIDPQYFLFLNSLKQHLCKSVLLVSNEPILAQGLKNAGLHVKRVVNFEKVTQQYDAVFFDYNLHVIKDREAFMEEGSKFATRLIGLCVPNRDPNAIIQATPNVVASWLKTDTCRPWNVMPLQNGVIFGCGVLNAPRKSKVTFFCGGEQTEDWGPLSHVDGGCGGSEEATIYLSRELAALGHEVEVINSFPHPCHVEGVEWRNISSMKPDEKFDNLILWRSPHFLDKYPIGGANKMFLWLHDVPQTYWFKPDRMEKIEKIFALSEYHKSLIPTSFHDKVIVSQNGVDLCQFDVTAERNPKKVIYTSSYDRGLEHLLHIWPEILREVPDAELDVYYGWGTYDKLRTEERQREWKSWMMCQMRDLKGVRDHGRIDQPTLAKKMVEAAIYAYPCHFEEISCISAMKAQIAGCYPLTTDYAALAETNLMDDKVKGNPRDSEAVLEAFKQRLIEQLKCPLTVDKRVEIQTKAREKFSWTSVAKTWAKLF